MRWPTCERCGRTLGAVEVTQFGDREPRYITTGPCDCQGYCSLCDQRIENGKCWNMDCVLHGHVVPIVTVHAGA